MTKLTFWTQWHQLNWVILTSCLQLLFFEVLERVREPLFFTTTSEYSSSVMMRLCENHSRLFSRAVFCLSSRSQGHPEASFVILLVSVLLISTAGKEQEKSQGRSPQTINCSGKNACWQPCRVHVPNNKTWLLYCTSIIIGYWPV